MKRRFALAKIITLHFCNFCSKTEKLHRLCFYICVRKFCTVIWHFLYDPYSVDSNEAMKRGDEVLNVSSLQFLRSVKRFIASLL
jgi:hypothetical protein